jgi:DNA (cytosine-5)-methyltransferase 1
MPHDCAPTIRASSVTPFHFSEDRCINVREAACLQSFPVDYEFVGSLGSQYRQVGNAVPVELSTAVAQSVRQILLHEYGDVC